MPREVFFIRGHENVLSTHKTTLEFTTEKELTRKGDCILGVSATKSMRNFSEDFKAALKQKGGLTITIGAGGIKDTIRAVGRPGLTFKDRHAIIIRKSSFVDSRTLAIKADKAAVDMDRRLVELLRKPSTKARVELAVERKRY